MKTDFSGITLRHLIDVTFLKVPGWTHVPEASGIRGLYSHSNPGAQSPIVYVGGQ